MTPNSVLVLKTVSADMTAYGGFRWPESGHVEAPDWSNHAECGGGLHGLLWGEGDGSLLNWARDAIWLVVEVDFAAIIDLGGKVKFPRGIVVHCGDRESATQYIVAHGDAGRAVVGVTATAGYGGQATAGYGGQATAGYCGQATAGDNGQATAGYGGQATAGYGGQATAGDGGIITIAYYTDRRRIKVGYIGEDGLKPNVAYRLSALHEFEEVQ